MWNELRFALRQVRRQPGFSATVVLTLVVGISVNAAMFAILHHVLLRPLPYPRPAELVAVWPEMSYPAGALITLRRPLDSLREVAGYAEATVSLAGVADPVRLAGARVSGEFFDVLGVAPQLGRSFRQGEDEAGAAPRVVLSHEMWAGRLGGDPAILGRLLRIDGVTHEVIGVMPRGFEFPSADTQLWLPLGIRPAEPVALWGVSYLRLFGRLAPGHTVASAGAELETLKDDVREGFPWRMPDAWGRDGQVVDLRESMVVGAGRRLWLAFGAVSLVFLIALANVSNLLLGRSVSRESEWAVRSALGASMSRLLRMAALESLVLGLMAGGLSMVVLAMISPWLSRVLPAGTPRLAEITFGPAVLGFVGLAALGAALASGWIGHLPLLARRSRWRPGQRGASLDREGASLARGVVVAQVALAFGLVFGAGLLVKSLWQLGRVHPGFHADGLLVAEVHPDASHTVNPGAVVGFYTTALERLRGRPGVTDAELIDVAPLTGRPLQLAFDAEDHPLPDGASRPMAWQHTISPGALQALGIPVLQGRVFTASDALRPGVILVNETLARRFWPGREAVGRKIRPVYAREWLTVVGVVGDVKQVHPAERAEPEIYLPFGPAQAPADMHLLVRSAAPVTAAATDLRGVLREISPATPVTDIRTLDQARAGSTAVQRWTARVLAGFAVIGLLLGALGVYAVMAEAVHRRTRELGIRLALGGQAADVVRWVLVRGLQLGCWGGLAGLGVALAFARLLRSQLHEVGWLDPWMLGIVALVFAGVVLAACWVPARRAARVDPLVALRLDQ